jgi:hypothetical protein
LKTGDNEVIVLDLVKTEPQPLRGAASLRDEAGLPAATVRPAAHSASGLR